MTYGVKGQSIAVAMAFAEGDSVWIGNPEARPYGGSGLNLTQELILEQSFGSSRTDQCRLSFLLEPPAP
jgi:hypothetical protein